ncbi:hypothetical protein [Catenisphaera adipataccumulans]|uniref:Uncharacterized protein n=1 Tax=Catenisphaera adipataccumulans TaxID=700500 RepID=A0A7W8CXT9_9FIRM|nr:hypothetical protein [Catenisphaera adipataccumulans]MBB5183598.1 hypothetical protein [Catenisphaera adipataccumulans]
MNNWGTFLFKCLMIGPKLQVDAFCTTTDAFRTLVRPAAVSNTPLHIRKGNVHGKKKFK